MNNYIMNIIGTTAGTNKFNAEGAWGGARWDGILNVGMYIYKKRVDSQKNLIFCISEYDPKWKETAALEMEIIKDKLSKFSWFKDIQHIGSTSIEGMSAKPLIDLMMGIDRSANVEDIREQLVSLGWFHYKAQFFDKITDNSRLTIHLCLFDSLYWKCRIAFRDHFVKNPEEIKNYSNLKKNLKNSEISFDEYVEGKQLYIYKILLREGFTYEEMITGGLFLKDPTNTKTILPQNVYFHFHKDFYTK